MKFLAALCLVGIGYMLGWRNAHLTVADECDRLGGFYVGTRVFKCVEAKAGEALK